LARDALQLGDRYRPGSGYFVWLPLPPFWLCRLELLLDDSVFGFAFPFSTPLSEFGRAPRPSTFTGLKSVPWRDVTFAFASRALQGPRFLFLDVENHLIADEVQQYGTVDRTPVYPREVRRRALILVNNHPSGDPPPSRHDVEMTRRLWEALHPLGIVLYDHLVIGHGKHASLRSPGLL
jgi:hypothetical protein